MGGAVGAQPRVPRDEGRAAAVRRRRVRAGGGDRGARARARARGHRGRDGARGPRRAPAGVRAPRAAVARAQPGPRRVREGPREHAGPPQPLVAPRVRGAAVAARRGRGDPLPVPVDHAARQGVTASEAVTSPQGEAVRRSSYGAGAKILSIGIASTGVVTFAYFSVASYALNDVDYKGISLLWSVMFVIVSVIYRPIEQLLSRTIAGRRARGFETGHPLRTPLLIQAGFALAFLVCALALKGPLEDGLFDGSAALYWVLVVGVLAYAVSYFARGWLAGHQWFHYYGGLVFMEATSRLLFAVAVAIGIASGQSVVAMGMAAAPFVSLVVVPVAFARRPRAEGPREVDEEALGLARGGRFAVAVLLIMAAEQTLLNAAVLTANWTAVDAAVAGYVFNVLLIARAPLQLFQAVQGSLLPHLAGLEATEGRAQFGRAIRITVLAIAGFAGLVALGLLLIGPWAMGILFDDAATYSRLGLAAVALGMGAHLAAGTLNQAALARDHAGSAAAAWLVSAVVFVAWMLADVVGDELARAEIGYLGAALLLCGLLTVVYRRGATSADAAPAAASAPAGTRPADTTPASRGREAAGADLDEAPGHRV